MSQAKIRLFCLLEFLEFCLSVVIVCSAFINYTSLCRSLKYLLKIPYFVQDYPNVPGFSKLFFEQVQNIAQNIEKINGICVW